MPASSKWLVGMVAATVVISAPQAFGWRDPMRRSYQWHGTLRILGAA